MIYEMMNLVRGLGSVDECKKAIESFRRMTVEAGFPGLHLQAVIYSENAVDLSGIDSAKEGSTKDLVELLGFDSVTQYQFAHITDCNRDYTEILDDVGKEWNRIHGEYKIPYYPHISIGWDNNPRHKFLTLPVIKNNTPENFKKGLVMARNFSDEYNSIPLITINSWNVWTEMSYLEPDDVYGYAYLEAVRDVFVAGKEN